MPRLQAESVSAGGGFIDEEMMEHLWSGLHAVWVPEGTKVDWEKIRPCGFHVVPRRRVVERTFAWLSTWRRSAPEQRGA